MQWMDYKSQHFLQGSQFPVHPALTAAEIDARRAESLNQAATPPQANQTREKRRDHYSRKRPASATSCARAGPVGSCSPGTPARHRSAVRTSASGEPGEGATARGPGAVAAGGAGPGAPRRLRWLANADPCSQSSAPRRRWAPRAGFPAPSGGLRAASPSRRPAVGSPPRSPLPLPPETPMSGHCPGNWPVVLLPAAFSPLPPFLLGAAGPEAPP